MNRRRKKLAPLPEDVADWQAVAQLSTELEGLVEAQDSQDGNEDAVLAIRRSLICVATATEAARRRIGQWYVLPRQKLIKEWDNQRWKQFFLRRQAHVMEDGTGSLPFAERRGMQCQTAFVGRVQNSRLPSTHVQRGFLQIHQ